MGVEVNGHFHGCFQLADDRSRARGAHEACHILEGDDFGAKTLHLNGEVDKILVGEYLFGSGGSILFLAEKRAEKAFLLGGLDGSFLLGIHGVAYGCVGDAAKLVDETYRLLDIVDVVERVEDTHYVKAVLDGFFVESFEDRVGVGNITEKVAAAGQSRQERLPAYGFGDGAQAIPRGFVEIAHH